MTIGFLGNVLGALSDVLQNQKGYQAFCPEFCPMQGYESRHPHLLHSFRSRNEDIIAMLNMMIDLQIYHCQQIQRLDKPKPKAQVSPNKPVDYSDTLDVILKSIRTVKRKLDEIPDVSGTISQIQKDEKKIQQQLSSLGENPIEQTLTPEKISRILKESFRIQNQEVTKSQERLMEKVLEILEEVKTDSEKAKPIELKTEENSKQILKLSKEISPVVLRQDEVLGKVTSLLEEVVVVLKEVKKQVIY